MRTAYCLHTTEGIPVRRLVETEDVSENLLKVTITDCDWDWNKKGKETSYVIPAPKESWRRTKHQVYHRQFRNNMNAQHNWRFEVHSPLSSLDV